MDDEDPVPITKTQWYQAGLVTNEGDRTPRYFSGDSVVVVASHHRCVRVWEGGQPLDEGIESGSRGGGDGGQGARLARTVEEQVGPCGEGSLGLEAVEPSHVERVGDDDPGEPRAGLAKARRGSHSTRWRAACDRR